LAQKSYKKKIHDKVMVYQTKKLPTGMKISRIMKSIEKTIPSHFLSEVEALIIADLAKITKEERLLEGDTIFISNEHYCEPLLVENFTLTVGESLYKKYNYVFCDDLLKKEFLIKRRDLYYDLIGFTPNLALSDFLNTESPSDFVRSIRKIEFEDVLSNTQKYFVNYESSLSLENYFSHLFNAHMCGQIRKRDYKNFLSIIKDIEKMCKEN